MERSNCNPLKHLFFDYDKLLNVSHCKIKSCLYPVMKGNHSVTASLNCIGIEKLQ